MKKRTVTSTSLTSGHVCGRAGTHSYYYTVSRVCRSKSPLGRVHARRARTPYTTHATDKTETCTSICDHVHRGLAHLSWTPSELRLLGLCLSSLCRGHTALLGVASGVTGWSPNRMRVARPTLHRRVPFLPVVCGMAGVRQNRTLCALRVGSVDVSNVRRAVSNHTCLLSWLLCCVSECFGASVVSIFA